MIGDDEKVFPVSQYYVQNIEVAMTLYSGAIEKAYMSIVASKVFSSTLVPFIGADGMFRIASGYVIKDYLEDEDRLSVEIHGDLNMSALKISISSYDMDSSKYVLPITNNLCVKVAEGTTTVSQDLAFLPGSELVVDEGAVVKASSGVSVFVYDLDEWEGKKYVYSSRDVSPLEFVGATWGAPKTRTMGDAKIEVNGTLDASEGYFYTTTGGANICSTGNGTVIIGVLDTSKKTYQATQSSSNISYSEITITPAKLKNGASGESGYTNTAGSNTYYYCLSHEQWSTDNHKAVVTITQPTCKTEGSVVASCSTKSRTVETIAKVSHAWLEQSVNGNVYTCTCKYKCGTDIALTVEYRLEDYLWFNGYTAQNFLVGDGVTVSENVQTVVSNGKRYFVRAIPADEIPNDLTFTVSVSGGTATFTVSLEDYQTGLGENHKYYDLCDKLITYGNAYVDYKDDDENLTSGTLAGNPFGDNNTSLVVQSQFDPSPSVGGIRVKTSGAKVYFDEALRLSVLYEMNGTLNGYTIVQVGLLVGDGTSELTTEAFVAAYLAYDETQNKGNVDFVPNLPKDNGTLIKLNDNASFTNPSTIPTSGELTFDLTSLQYSQSLSLRPVFVLTDGTNYYCVYGRQVKYGLAEYINAKYADTKTTNEYRYLLETVWAVALEAQKAFGG